MGDRRSLRTIMPQLLLLLNVCNWSSGIEWDSVIKTNRVLTAIEYNHIEQIWCSGRHINRYVLSIGYLRSRIAIAIKVKWRIPSLSKLTLIIFDMKITHLDSEASCSFW